MVPGVRTLISVPAGVSGMPLGPFLVSTLTGSAIWTVILVLAGYELGERYSQVASVIEPVSNAVLALAVIWYLWRVARSEEHTSELQALMRISYAVFCLKTKKNRTNIREHTRMTS